MWKLREAIIIEKTFGKKKYFALYLFNVWWFRECLSNLCLLRKDKQDGTVAIHVAKARAISHTDKHRQTPKRMEGQLKTKLVKQTETDWRTDRQEIRKRERLYR